MFPPFMPDCLAVTRKPAQPTQTQPQWFLLHPPGGLPPQRFDLSKPASASLRGHSDSLANVFIAMWIQWAKLAHRKCLGNSWCYFCGYHSAQPGRALGFPPAATQDPGRRMGELGAPSPPYCCWDPCHWLCTLNIHSGGTCRVPIHYTSKNLWDVSTESSPSSESLSTWHLMLVPRGYYSKTTAEPPLQTSQAGTLQFSLQGCLLHCPCWSQASGENAWIAG